MHWKIPLVIAFLLTSMSGATLYYRTLYYDAEKARKIAVSDREKQQIAFEQLNHQMQTISALDTQHTKELEHDKTLLPSLSEMWLLVAAGCASKQPVPMSQPMPPPPAWMMQPAPDLLTPLNEIISLSDGESK